MIESEREDDEVKQEAIVTLACMAQTLLEPKNIPAVLAVIKEVCITFNIYSLSTKWVDYVEEPMKYQASRVVGCVVCW